jgi:hypothetical protein
VGGLPAHRGRTVKQSIAAHKGRLAVEQSPAFALELNPVEYIWGYWKHHELPNFSPRDFIQLSRHARPRFGAHAPSAHPGDGFLGQAELFPL